MEVARLRAHADAAEVRVVADVDRDAGPHARPAPAPRPPRLVAVAARLAERVAHAVGLDPAAPAAGLLEMPRADACARGGARPGAGAALAIAADRGRERVEDEVEGDARGARRAAPAEVAHAGVGVARDAPLRHGVEALVADAGHGEVAVGHLVLRADAVDGRELRSGEPDREADVHRATPRPACAT